MAEWHDRIVFRNPGRQLGPSDDLTEAADRQVWREAITQLRERQYLVHETRLAATVDWEPYAVAREREADRAIVTVSWKSEGPLRPTDDLTEQLAYEAFLCLHLAVPGCFTFSGAQIVHGEAAEATDFPPIGVHIEDAYIQAIDNGWPELRILPLRSVVTWYDALAIGTRQVATDIVDKALFTLLHICNMQGAEPASMMWIAQCLESLYSVPTALSKTLVTRRSAELLALPPQRYDWARKRFNSFFELRNAILHGGAPVVHPVRQDFWDSRVLESQDLLDETAFGVAVIVATLQRFIENQWRGLEFAELLRPTPLN